MARDGSAATGALQARIQRYYGGRGRILEICGTARPGAFLFVIDAMERGRLIRTLGTIGRSGALLEQSAMDLERPDRLVFAYERAMLLSLALAPDPRSVLLLGLGGGAMVRHLAAHVPEAALTVVDRDPQVIALARRHFHLRRAVTQADALEFVADAQGEYDVVMVDLYDASGVLSFDERFWEDCRAALRPGGAIAVNWAGSLQGGLPREPIDRAMAALPGAFLLVVGGVRPNVVLLASTDASFQTPDLAARLRNFGVRQKLPREDRDILRRCEVRANLSRRPRKR
jgi:predicted O-methyltransferase YrrM